MEISIRSTTALTLIMLLTENAMGACLNGHPSVAQEYRNSYAVFIGEVISENPEATSRGFFDGTSYVVRLREAFRGKPNKTLTLFSENSSGRFPMKMGEAYLLFVYQLSGRTMVDNCGNSKLLSLATKEITAIRRLK